MFVIFREGNDQKRSGHKTHLSESILTQRSWKDRTLEVTKVFGTSAVKIFESHLKKKMLPSRWWWLLKMVKKGGKLDDFVGVSIFVVLVKGILRPEFGIMWHSGISLVVVLGPFAKKSKMVARLKCYIRRDVFFGAFTQATKAVFERNLRKFSLASNLCCSCERGQELVADGWREERSVVNKMVGDGRGSILFQL